MESVERLMIDFFKNKKIFITGHTGFKGTWLCKILMMLGADITGYSLHYPTVEGEKIFKLSGVQSNVNNIIGDVRDYENLKKVFDECCPEIVIHLAAQPIVLEGYRNPIGTYSTNVIGTVNLLECIRNSECVKSFLNVTTDKVYENKEWCWGYRETDILDGYDPYSNSKSCADLVTHSYAKSFLLQKKVAVSTARAGNVIGGGDFAMDRIIPDCIKAAYNREMIIVRSPYSIRPYQHVLEPLFAYLMILEKQFNNIEYAGAYNIGPDDCDCITTGRLVDIFCEKWGNEQKWKNINNNGPHEAQFLKLDCSKAKQKLGWRPHWHIDTAVEKTVEWAKIYKYGGSVSDCMERQIKEYFKVVL